MTDQVTQTRSPIASGLANDAPAEPAPTSPRLKEVRLRALSARHGYSIETLRRMPEDTLRRLWADRNEIISHTADDGSTTHVRDIVAGRGVEGGPIQSTTQKDHGVLGAEGKLPSYEAEAAKAEKSATTRDKRGRFLRRGSK